MPVETVEVAPVELSVAVGLAGQLTATTKAADGTVLVGRTIVWSTSEGGIATVDATGMVTGVAVGAATITATSEGKSGTATVNVSPADFEPLGDTTLEGDVSFGSVTIPAGVTVTITDDLDLDVAGDISIAGTITGDCVEVDVSGGGAVAINGNVDNDCGAPPAGGGPPLSIIGNGTFDIDGSAMASDGDITLKNDPLIVNPPDGVSGGSSAQLAEGLNGPFPCTLKNYTVVTGAAAAATGANGNPSGGPGSNGTGFIFACNGDLAFKGNVQIETQEGGAGGNGTDQSNTAAVGTGGAGGWGGGLFIWAFGNLSFTMEVTGTEIKNHFFSGRGGDGGMGTGTGLDNDNVDPAAAGTGIGGPGGSAGIIDFQTSGDLSVAAGVLFVGPGTSAPSGGADGGGDGGVGVGVGAHGKHAANRAPGKPAQIGGAAVGLGGTGGDAPGFHTIILGGQTGFEDIVVDAGDAGWGGDGDADAGRGGNGDEDSKPGADGGPVTAKGGGGGNALFSSRGGDGGDAYFRGARGGNGWDDCILPVIVAGGPGGNGGAATGGGGPLGSGLNPGSVGKHYTSNVSNGGDGGNGAPVGAMGIKGGNSISDPFASGPGGGGNSHPPEKIEIGGGSFMDGDDGDGCNLGGWFDFGISVLSDPAGHHPFVGMPGQMQIWVGAIATGPTTGTFFLSGTNPLVHVEGTWNPETGEIMASGVGTVAGFPNTQVTFTGTFIDGVITGTYQMGGEGLEPGVGGLPGGVPIKYTLTGTRAPG